MELPLESTNGLNGHGEPNGHKENSQDHHEPMPESRHIEEEARNHRKAAIEDAVRSILINVGENPDREGLVRTPHRVAKAWFELLEGYDKDLETVVNDALFTSDYNDGEMVIVADIPYQSMCEHHMLPFTGRAHVAYIPNGKVIGLSKIPRIVDMFARRLQIQEQLTNEIADAVDEALAPLGVMVMLSGNHTCGSLRGVKKHGVNMVTTALRGEFKRSRELRTEFYALLERGQASKADAI